MFDVGFLELVLLAIIAMVVIGPERLPKAARTVGQTVGKVRRFFVSMQHQLDQEVRLDEINRKIMEQTQGQEFTNNISFNPEAKDDSDSKPLESDSSASTASADPKPDTPSVDTHESGKS
jgi:sec-independent protein translocase protein TatB